MVAGAEGAEQGLQATGLLRVAFDSTGERGRKRADSLLRHLRRKAELGGDLVNRARVFAEDAVKESHVAYSDSPARRRTCRARHSECRDE